MLVALLTYDKDVEATAELLRWMEELGGCKGHSLVICADAGTPYDKILNALAIGRRVFDNAHLIVNERSVIGWVEGPKSLVLRMIQYGAEVKQPWLLMDSDAIPLTIGWLDRIATEYQSCGKPYMGYLFPCKQPGIPSLLMSPIAVYPPEATELTPLIQSGHHWDVSMTPIVVPKCHNTTLIQHLFGEMGNPPTFAKVAVPGTATFSPESINQGAVVFHRNKDGTLINLLRERMGKGFRTPQETNAEAFFQMGRFGDLILLLPAFKEWADRTGEKSIVFTSKEFGNVLDGASYVKPIKLPHNWHLQAGEALRFARSQFPDIRRTQLHGVGLTPATPDSLASYSLSMWERAGLLELYHKLPLVFDRRSPEREADLIKKTRRTDKPLLLVNLKGATSPLGCELQFIPPLTHALGGRFEIINTSETKAWRIYDLLGLMDVAAGLITIDTATLHLAAAAKCPYIALTRNDGQAGSVPKGNVALQVGYDHVMQRLPDIFSVIETWLR